MNLVKGKTTFAQAFAANQGMETYFDNAGSKPADVNAPMNQHAVELAEQFKNSISNKSGVNPNYNDIKDAEQRVAVMMSNVVTGQDAINAANRAYVPYVARIEANQTQPFNRALKDGTNEYKSYDTNGNGFVRFSDICNMDGENVAFADEFTKRSGRIFTKKQYAYVEQVVNAGQRDVVIQLDVVGADGHVAYRWEELIKSVKANSTLALDPKKEGEFQIWFEENAVKRTTTNGSEKVLVVKVPKGNNDFKIEMKPVQVLSTNEYARISNVLNIREEVGNDMLKAKLKGEKTAEQKAMDMFLMFAGQGVDKTQLAIAMAQSAMK